MAVSAMNSPAAQKTSGLAITSLVHRNHLLVLSNISSADRGGDLRAHCPRADQEIQGAIGGGRRGAGRRHSGLHLRGAFHRGGNILDFRSYPKMQSTIDLGVNIQNAQKIHMAMEANGF